MCYNYSVNRRKEDLTERYLAKTQLKIEWQPMFSVSGFKLPYMPVITQDKPDTVQLYAWGLIPAWVKDKATAELWRTKTLNAVSEEVFEKASFKHAIFKRRCLVPCTGFFEWRHLGRQTYPYWIGVKDVPIFSLAGIYEQWVDKLTGEVYDTFSILTTAANSVMEQIHNNKRRMPVILAPETERRWLDPTLNKEDIKELMHPFPSERLDFHTISKLITSRTLDSNVPEVIALQDYPELAPVIL